MFAERYNSIDEETTLLHAAHTAWNALARLELLLRCDVIQVQDKKQSGIKYNTEFTPVTKVTIVKENVQTPSGYIGDAIAIPGYEQFIFVLLPPTSNDPESIGYMGWRILEYNTESIIANPVQQGIDDTILNAFDLAHKTVALFGKSNLTTLITTTYARNRCIVELCNTYNKVVSE